MHVRVYNVYMQLQCFEFLKYYQTSTFNINVTFLRCDLLSCQAFLKSLVFLFISQFTPFLGFFFLNSPYMTEVVLWPSLPILMLTCLLRLGPWSIGCSENSSPPTYSEPTWKDRYIYSTVEKNPCFLTLNMKYSSKRINYNILWILFFSTGTALIIYFYKMLNLQNCQNEELIYDINANCI